MQPQWQYDGNLDFRRHRAYLSYAVAHQVVAMLYCMHPLSKKPACGLLVTQDDSSAAGGILWREGQNTGNCVAITERRGTEGESEREESLADIY